MEGKHLVSRLLAALMVISVSLPLQWRGAAQASGTVTMPQASSVIAVGGSAPESAQAALESLQAKASSSGSLLVLAELALPKPFTAEAETSPADVAEQRAAIAAASDAVLAALEGTGTQVGATFTTLPYMAVRVDAEALAELASLPEVTLALVYTSATPELALLETLVHLEEFYFDELPAHVLATIEVPESAIIRVEVAELPNGWDSIYTSPTTQQFTNHWFKQQSSLVMAIPSVIVPISFNYLINPNHPRMKEVKVVESIPFSFDSRFFK